MKSFFDWFKKRFTKWYQPDAEMAKMLHALAMTEEHEISCDDVFAVLDQFAEAVRRGENVLLLMPLVRQHRAAFRHQARPALDPGRSRFSAVHVCSLRLARTSKQGAGREAGF